MGFEVIEQVINGVAVCIGTLICLFFVAIVVKAVLKITGLKLRNNSE